MKTCDYDPYGHVYIVVQGPRFVPEVPGLSLGGAFFFLL